MGSPFQIICMLLCSVFLEKSAHKPKEFHNTCSLIWYAASKYSYNSFLCFKGAFLPHSWEDINSELNFSQMLYSARIYQLPLTNGLCCIQTTHTVQILHWKCYNTEFTCTERKASISITFILGYKLTNQS